MRKKNRVLITFFLTVVILIIVVNLPIIPYTSAQCYTEYESPTAFLFPCGFPYIGCVHSSSLKTITISSAYLFSGYSANPSSPATAKAEFSFNNPSCSETTYITSFALTANGNVTITNLNNSTNPISASNAILFATGQPGVAVLPARVSSFTFYPAVLSGSALTFPSGQTYEYIVNFANGQSVSGSGISI